MILPTATIILASLFTLISSLLTLHHIHAHLVNYKNPKIQRKAIRIIIMPALYAITSWIQILSTNLAVVTEAVRGVYEAFVVWTFFGVLIEYAGGEESLLNSLENELHYIHHPMPCSACYKPITIGSRPTFLLIKRAILQFALLKPILTTLTLILTPSHTYQEGLLSWSNAWPYFTFLQNIMVTISIYALYMFYLGVKDTLQTLGIDAWPKFLSIKGVIFLTFWQGVAVHLIFRIGQIRADDAEAAAALSTAIQDFIITLEMIPIAFYHRYAFPVGEIPMMNDMPLPSLFSAMKDSMGFSDVIRDGFTTLRGDWLGPDSMIAFNNRGIVPARSQSSLPKLSSRVYRYGTTSNTTQPIQLPVDEAASMSLR